VAGVGEEGRRRRWGEGGARGEQVVHCHCLYGD
jgi:hypothetical protein